MAKNDKLINSLKEIAAKNRAANVQAASERDTPQIYAAIAIALYRKLGGNPHDKPDAINDVFAESQKIWFECVEEGGDILGKCKDETGIDLQGGEKT